MVNKQFPYPLLLALILLGTTVLYAQDLNPASQAFHTWREKKVTAEMAAEGKFIGIAFAVTKLEEHSARVDIAVGAGKNVPALGRVTFVVQPVLMKQDLQGKSAFESIGRASTLNFPELENIKSSDGDIIADPHITVLLPAEAAAIKITVNNGLFGTSVLLPLLDKTSTAILGGTIETEAQGLKCQWYSGDCGGATFCIGCSTSPNLNCVNCQVSCNDGGACTPGSPRPPYCSGQ